MIGDLPLGGHFHNTRGCGLASAYAAVSSGVTRLDARSAAWAVVRSHRGHR